MKLSIPLKMIRTPRTNQFIMRNSRCIGYFSRASLGFRVLIEVIDLSEREPSEREELEQEEVRHENDDEEEDVLGVCVYMREIGKF